MSGKEEENIAIAPLSAQGFGPATRSDDHYHIQAVAGPSEDFLLRDLYSQRLHDVLHLLWLAGRPLPPRPLHQQLLLRRQIAVAEPIELHLVWNAGTFYVKPLPRYLLDEAFVKSHIKSSDRLARSALGLLYSYTALVRHESDFHLAREKRLLPSDLTWAAWQAYTQRFYLEHPDTKIYTEIDERYCYGELRLGRLNKMYRLFPQGLNDVVYGYSTLTAKHQARDVFSDNLRTIGAILAYSVIVLQAMQVGLSTEYLSSQEAFQRACYGFAIFSTVAPLALVGSVFVVFLFLALVNFTSTLAFERLRFGNMGIVPPRKKRK